MGPDKPDEVEISLDGDAGLELTTIEIDSEEVPLEFSVDGVIRGLDSSVLNDLQGQELKPVAVRFQRLSSGE